MTHQTPIILRYWSLATLLVGLNSGLIPLELSAASPSAARFTDNRNGTITDTTTKLIWLKNTTCLTLINGRENEIGALNWGKATTWVAGLTSGKCGLRDGSQVGQWRLPSKDEWMALVDKDTANPKLPAGHPFMGVRFNEYYWSSTTDASESGRAWFVYLGRRDVVDVGIKTDSLYVWPVRSEQSATPIPITTRFIDNHDGTVTDRTTELMWLKNTNCHAHLDGIEKTGSLNFDSAITWTAALANRKCGLRDGSKAGQWRLPSCDELQSLITTEVKDPALPVGHPFVDVQTRGYWSTTPADGGNKLCTVAFYVGQVVMYSRTNTGYVWPVRDGQ